MWNTFLWKLSCPEETETSLMPCALQRKMARVLAHSFLHSSKWGIAPKLNHYHGVIFNYVSWLKNVQGFFKTQSFCQFRQVRQYAKSLEPGDMSPLVSASQMKHFLNGSGLGYVEGPTCIHVACPFCPHSNKGLEKIGTLYINMTTGMFLCFSCHQSGSWNEFQDYLAMIKIKKDSQERISFPTENEMVFSSQEQFEEIQQVLSSATPLAQLEKVEMQEVIKKFNIKGLRIDYFKKYRVYVNNERTALLFPLDGFDKKTLGIKFLFLSTDENQKDRIELLPRNICSAAFGLSAITKQQNEIVLTSTPLDAIAVNQETNVPAIALPRGTAALPQEILPMLERFHRVILWFSNVMQDWEAAKMFARKLGGKRCHFIRPQEDHPAPLAGLQSCLNLLQILKESQPITHHSITTFQSLRQDVLAELSHVDQIAGVKWKRYPALNRLLKGHRRGELTVFTGPTGSGKTTFMSEYSLDLCIQGVNTLWGSFEIKNVRLAKMMLTQFSLLPLEKHLDQYDYWADKFELLPLYFMTFHGQESLRNVMDAMAHAVYVHDIQHVVVDNVQFMLGTDAHSRLDRFWKQDLIVAAFRKFATRHNCHVTLVMHPRKEREVDELNNNSIFGGAKASQEADNIIILQDRRLNMLKGRKYLQVTKNRYDGDIGLIPLEFDKDCLSFVSKKKSRKTTVSEEESRETDQKPFGLPDVEVS